MSAATMKLSGSTAAAAAAGIGHASVANRILNRTKKAGGGARQRQQLQRQKPQTLLSESDCLCGLSGKSTVEHEQVDQKC